MRSSGAANRVQPPALAAQEAAFGTKMGSSIRAWLDGFARLIYAMRRFKPVTKGAAVGFLLVGLLLVEWTSRRKLLFLIHRVTVF
jgi:hypothetical protein